MEVERSHLASWRLGVGRGIRRAGWGIRMEMDGFVREKQGGWVVDGFLVSLVDL